MAAKKKEFKVWSAADLGLADNQVGRAGAMYEVKEVLIPERKSRVEILTRNARRSAAETGRETAQGSEGFEGSMRSTQ